MGSVCGGVFLLWLFGRKCGVFTLSGVRGSSRKKGVLFVCFCKEKIFVYLFLFGVVFA